MATDQTSRMIMRRNLAIVILLLAATALWGQGSQADYDRAAAMQAATRNKVHRSQVRPHWLAGGTKFWYRVTTGAASSEFILVDAESGSRRPAFDHERLAQSLAAEIETPVDAAQLPFRSLRFDESLTEVTFTAHGKRWSCNLETYQLRQTGQRRKSRRADCSIVTASAGLARRWRRDEHSICQQDVGRSSAVLD